MRYLEQCLADLKTIHAQCPRPTSKSPATAFSSNALTSRPSADPTTQSVSEEDDQEMADVPSHAHDQRPRLPSISPALLPENRGMAHQSPLQRTHTGNSATPTSTFVPYPPSSFSAALPSPSFESNNATPASHGVFG